MPNALVIKCRVCAQVCKRNGNRGRLPEYCGPRCRKFQEYVDGIETLLPEIAAKMDLASKSMLRGMFWSWGNYFRIPKRRTIKARDVGLLG